MTNRILSLYCLICMLAIILIKDYIRPKHLKFSETGIFLQGTLPNFFAAFGLTTLVYIISKFLDKRLTSQSIASLFFASATTFLGLFIWEFVRYYFGKMNFDFEDIFMTFLGCALAFLLINKTINIINRKITKQNNSPS